MSNITKRDNAKSKKSRVVTLVRDTLSGLYYISTKYHRKIPKCIRVTERTGNLFQIKQSVITLKVCLFVLRFYGPVNPMGSCRARSVYLTTRLLGRLSPLSG